MAEYIITQEDLDQGNIHLQTLTAEHPVCRIADGVRGVPDNAFFDCSGLTSITIPDSAFYIGHGAFNGCSGLTSITIGNGVTSIGRSAFEICTGLTSITIPSSVTSIGGDVFFGCTSLTTIYVSEDFDTTLLDGKVPEGVTIEVIIVEKLITLSQLKAYDDEKTNIWHNSFTTNNLTVSNSVINNAAIDNANVTDLTVNNSTVVNGNVFTHMGFDVASTNIIDEDRYNNLGDAARNDAFYVTSPNGNMYFMGAKWVPSYVPYYSIAYVYLPNMANNMQALTTSTLTFTSGAVTNSFVNGDEYSTIYKKTPFGLVVDRSLPVGTQANDGSIITNANELYIVDASNMYKLCYNLTDTFICNPSLVTNAPSDYDPMRYCTNMANMFRGCHNFNQPIRIPDWVTNMDSTFLGCNNFNQPVNIPDSVLELTNTFYNCNHFNQPVKIGNSVTNMDRTFYGCHPFNQPVNIPDSVTSMASTFYWCNRLNQPVKIGNSVTNMDRTFIHCNNFNQPVNIPDSVTTMSETFRNCINLNQPVNIPNGVTNMNFTFYNCNNFNQPVNIPDSVLELTNTFYNCKTLSNSTVPIHISHTIALGNTSNYIYSSLVWGRTGISFAPNRILNDL